MILNIFLSLLTSILFLATDWTYEMSVSKGIFMCLLLGVIKIADMNVNAKIWFPGQQIKPLGGAKHTWLFVRLQTCQFDQLPIKRIPPKGPDTLVPRGLFLLIF